MSDSDVARASKAFLFQHPEQVSPGLRTVWVFIENARGKNWPGAGVYWHGEMLIGVRGILLIGVRDIC